MRSSSRINIIIVLISIALGFFIKNFIIGIIFKPRQSNLDRGVSTSQITQNVSNPLGGEKNIQEIEIIAQDLNIPWDLRFLPQGDILVTERPGRLLRIGKETQTVSVVEGVAHRGEGGLLGIVLDPDFTNNYFVYLYLTTEEEGKLKNRVERYKYEDNKLVDRKTILSGINGSSNHDGGRIEFGKDGFLYVTTGDAEKPSDSTNKNSLNGKILRVTKDGKAAPGNPFGNEVYSYGHRNPQGLVWDEVGNLWETEHGPSGTRSGNDEVNLIKMGFNYGWPNFVGSQTGDGIDPPVLESGGNDTWAPASLAYLKGSLFFGGLRGEALYQAKIKEGNTLEIVEHFKKEFGRIRTVRVGPDGFIYMTTSNRDGRGNPKKGDDKIVKINPDLFFK